MPRIGMRSTVAAALPGTIGTIVEKTGMAESTARRWLVKMRADEPKTVHIKQWRRNNGLPTPYYAAGPGKDAAFPKKKTQAQYSQKWRAARREERQERAEALAQTQKHIEHAKRSPRKWTSALMGAPA